MAAMSGARGLPRTVWTLGLVSLLMDFSSETIHALLPVYLVTAMGASFAEVGWIEGVAEATASITKLFSGALSDWLGKRQLLAAIGYGLAALSKPIFPLAGSLGWIVAARFVDRVGKGVRGAPRDALIAAATPAELRGAAYGLRQTLDTIGAFAGPLTAMALMAASRDNFRLVFWAATPPALLAAALIAFGVKESEAPKRPARFPLHIEEMRQLGAAFWSVIGLSAVFSLARFSEAFLILRAEQAGLPIALSPTVLIVMNVVYAAAAYPAGALSDRFGRAAPLALGILTLVAADLLLALASGLWSIGLGVALWGLHLGFTQGLLSALVADTTPDERRGVAFGLFNLVSGVMLLIASALGGWLWDRFGPSAPFLAGASFAALSLALLWAQRRAANAVT
jgi:MFS family permease